MLSVIWPTYSGGVLDSGILAFTPAQLSLSAP